MTKISNQVVYIPDIEISGLDYFIGTDIDQGKRTVNFRMEDVGSHFNMVNGVRNFDFNFYEHQGVNPKPSDGYFYSNDNNQDPNNITHFIFSKKTARNKDSSTFFESIATDNPFDLIISQKIDDNTVFFFKIDSIETFSNYYKLNVSEVFFPQGKEISYKLSYAVFNLKSEGISAHNSLNGLNDGDYIHLTQEEKVKFDNLPDEFVTKHSELDLDDGSNPHNTTKVDVGLGDVDNTSDLDKPISTATQSALDAKLDASAYNDRFKGKYTSLANLQSAHTTANDGDYAIVDAGSDTDAVEYIWDADEGWVKGTNTGATTTDALPEGSSNLYFTAARVLATVLSGISFATGGAIVSTDTVLQALGKVQKQINDLSSVFVPLTRTLTINGTTADLSADRTFLTKAEILEWFSGDEYSVQATGSALSNYGMSSPTTVGTASNIAANYSGGFPGNPIAFYPHRTSSTGTTIGNTAEFYENTNKLVANELGFVFHGRESFTWASGCASYAGLTDSNTVTGNVNPSTLLNSIIYGADDTDSNLQFMHNDGSGTATKHDMGSNFALQSNNAYRFMIWNLYGSNTVYIWVLNLRNGAVYQTNVNSDLPASTVGLAPHLWTGNRATSNNVAQKFSYFKIKRQH